MDIFRDCSLDNLEKLREYFESRLMDAENAGFEMGVHQYKWFLLMLEQEFIYRINNPEPEKKKGKKKKKKEELW